MVIKCELNRCLTYLNPGKWGEKVEIKGLTRSWGLLGFVEETVLEVIIYKSMKMYLHIIPNSHDIFRNLNEKLYINSSVFI